MGAWGVGIFENDAAMDWTVDFQHAPSEQTLRATFEATTVDGYLEREVGCSALAAAELLAASRGKPCQDIPQALQDWAAASPGVATPELRAQALAAIERVMIEESSEVAESWLTTDDAAEWKALVEDLKKRLS